MSGEMTHSMETLHPLTYHVLSLSEDGEETVMPLLNVNVQEPGTGEGAAAGAAHISV